MVKTLLLIVGMTGPERRGRSRDLDHNEVTEKHQADRHAADAIQLWNAFHGQRILAEKELTT